MQRMDHTMLVSIIIFYVFQPNNTSKVASLLFMIIMSRYTRWHIRISYKNT